MGELKTNFCSNRKNTPSLIDKSPQNHHGYPDRENCASVSIHRVATCQGNVREKQNFLQVKEKSGNFEKMSGNFSHLTHVRELSGNFVMSCQGIVREFFHEIIFRLNPPSYNKGSNCVVFM